MKEESSTIRLQKPFVRVYFLQWLHVLATSGLITKPLWIVSSPRESLLVVGERAFTTEEESRLVKFVSDRLSLGCGIDFSQLCTVIQELANTHQAPDLHQARPPSAFQLCLRLPAPQFLSPLKSRQTSGSGRTACLSKDRSLRDISF